MPAIGETMPVERNPIPKHSGDEVEDHLRLAKEIVAGSVPAWHEFLRRYSNLIFKVLRRHLMAEDDDDIRSMYVDILRSLYEKEIGKYRGNVRLTTWLIVYTRSRALDFYRKRHGRYRTPEGYEKLSEMDRNVLQWYFIKKLPMEIVLELLEWKGLPASVDDIVRSIGRIEDIMGERYLNRIQMQHQARECRAESAGMLKYLIQLRFEHEEKMQSARPDGALVEKEAEELMARARELVAALPHGDRELMALRFDRGLSAKEIAEELKIEGPRRVYTAINRVVRKLRRSMTVGRNS